MWKMLLPETDLFQACSPTCYSPLIRCGMDRGRFVWVPTPATSTVWMTHIGACPSRYATPYERSIRLPYEDELLLWSNMPLECLLNRIMDGSARRLRIDYNTQGRMSYSRQRFSFERHLTVRR